MKRFTLGIEIAFVVVVLVGIITLADLRNTQVPQEILQEAPTVPPPMTELMAQVLEGSTGFQHLVSYTDNGFTPQTLDIKKGETIRFTNNSSAELWVAAQAGEDGIYPRGRRESCSQSAFDSCVALQPNEFWEFTFNAVGAWPYINNGRPADTATVRVQ